MVGNLGVLRALGFQVDALYFSVEGSKLRDEHSLELLADQVTHGGTRRAYESFSVTERIRDRATYVGRAALNQPGHRYPFSVRWDAIGANKVILNHCLATDTNLVLLPSIFLHYIPELCDSGLTVICDAADILSVVTRRTVVANRRNILRLPGLIANFISTRSQEHIFLHHCSEVWVTSLEEAQIIRTRASTLNVVIVPNTVPVPPAGTRDLSNADVVAFIGTYSYAPNLQAAQELALNIFPMVRELRPTAVLRLAGSGLGDQMAAAFRRVPGVEVLGPVDDAKAFLQSAGVIALPIRVRGGVPLKLVEALALGCPVVATPELVCGLDLQSGREVLVADHPQDVAAAIASLLGDRGLARELGAAGRDAFDRLFSHDAVMRVVRRDSLLARHPLVITDTPGDTCLDP